MYLLKMFWNKNCLISLFWSCVGKFCKVNYNGKRKRNTFSWNFYETKREKHTQIPIQIVFKLLRLQVDAVRWAKVIILKFSRGKGAGKVDRERVLLIPSAAGCTCPWHLSLIRATGYRTSRTSWRSRARTTTCHRLRQPMSENAIRWLAAPAACCNRNCFSPGLAWPVFSLRPAGFIQDLSHSHLDFWRYIWLKTDVCRFAAKWIFHWLLTQSNHLAFCL